jgi:hypothetical protein
MAPFDGSWSPSDSASANKLSALNQIIGLRFSKRPDASESKTHHKLTNNNPTLEQNLQTAKLSLIRFERSQTVQCGDRI